MLYYDKLASGSVSKGTGFHKTIFKEASSRRLSGS